MKLSISTDSKRQVVNITDQIQESVKGLSNGICVISVLHTTCALTIAELDPGTDQDLLNFLESIIPNIDWRHSHDPGHVPAHLLSALIGTSLTLPVENGQVTLGTWQSIVLIELGGPRERQLEVKFISEE